jgi:hypothetical protein
MPHHKKGTTLGTWNITLGPTLATKQFLKKNLDDFFFSNSKLEILFKITKQTPKIPKNSKSSS